MNRQQFLAVLRETVDENPFASRALLRILAVEFTDRVATLAVTCQDKPRLLVNLAFVTKHCRCDDHVKAVLCHEFLHVLLRHTETAGPLTRARHIAFDAVINAIICRQYGEPYASFFSRFYARETGATRLLRPMTDEEAEAFRRERRRTPDWMRAWFALYDGQLVADDIEQLADDLLLTGSSGGDLFSTDHGPGSAYGDLLGNHGDLGPTLAPPIKTALDQALKELSGSGIWRSPHERGIGVSVHEALVSAANLPLRQWQATTLAVLRRHLAPSHRSRALDDQPVDYRMPVLSGSDRRAFMRTLWDPILPQALWAGSVRKPRATAQVYLDVSGSMRAEMPAIVALLARVSSHIRRPFWAFSDEVAPAVIDRGQLKASTSGGTSMDCVLAHIARTRPVAAVVVTDGYIEKLDPGLVHARLGATRLHAIVSRDGNPAALRAAGIPYTQLQELPR